MSDRTREVGSLPDPQKKGHENPKEAKEYINKKLLF